MPDIKVPGAKKDDEAMGGDMAPMEM